MNGDAILELNLPVLLTSLPPVVQDGDPKAPFGPVQRLHVTALPGQEQRPQAGESRREMPVNLQRTLVWPQTFEVYLEASMSKLPQYLLALLWMHLKKQVPLDKSV